MEKTSREILPGEVNPVDYNIILNLNMTKFTFSGSQTVIISITSPINKIQIHTRDLQIQNCICNDQQALIQYGEPITTFIFDEQLPVGIYELKMSFTGIINDQMAGLYRSKYTSQITGEDTYMASTQFEALDARRCFPCWDEPNRKATFTLTLEIDNKLEALSNMPVKESKLIENNMKRISFEKTPKMSTYLLALSVGKLEYLETKTKNNVKIRVYTVPGRKKNGKFALDTGKRCLELFDEFFGIPYPLPKLDMIAIPEFAAGAMENWGLVTYRETALLLDKNTASPQQRQRVAIVVAHELAHQWFGNLVTMDWWNDLWLNEGFASWMENYIIDILFPEWGIWEQFIVSAQGRALQLDSLESSHPIQVPIQKAEEVEEVFDAISYSKGASVIRMIYKVLGKDAFQKGLQNYMQTHKYKNTITNDLWNAWEESSKKPIDKIMESWTKTTGYPVVSVNSMDKNGDNIKFGLTQERFMGDGSQDLDNIWIIPIVYGEEVRFMTQRSQEIIFEYNESTKLNTDQYVPIRVHYIAKNSQPYLNTLSVEDRIGILSDSTALCKAGRMSYLEFLNILSKYIGEDNGAVWMELNSTINEFRSLLIDLPEYYKSFQEIATNIVDKGLQTIGWNAKFNESHLSETMRGLVIGLGVHFGDYSENALKIFKSNNIPNVYRTSVYKMALKSTEYELTYKKLRQMFIEEINNAKQIEILTAIGYVKSSKLKQDVLEWAISGDIRLQDFFYPIGSVARSSKIGQVIAWEFFVENFDRIHKMLEAASPSLMGTLVTYCCGGFNTFEKANMAEQFFNEKRSKLKKSWMKVEQNLETIRTNAKFLELLEVSDLVNKMQIENNNLEKYEGRSISNIDNQAIVMSAPGNYEFGPGSIFVMVATFGLLIKGIFGI
tara:strand:+ start:10669 stop:13350 length:2682 start_codon:yes stop_codon:yes gene_type:complete